jgi:hypothetical protein
MAGNEDVAVLLIAERLGYLWHVAGYALAAGTALCVMCVFRDSTLQASRVLLRVAA